MIEKKIILILISIFLIFSCSLTKRVEKHNIVIVENNLYEIIEKKYDSLRTCGIDTMLIYISDCSGCIKGSKKWGSIFWVKNNKKTGIYFDNYEAKTKAFNLRLDVFKYYFNNRNLIKNEFLEEPKISLMHYNFSKIYIMINDKIEFESKDLNEFQRYVNIEKKIFSWIFMVENNVYSNFW